ncbi:MAG TPA: methyltransferase domain-containing protein [Bryobacteraceae bacterium]|nr:methyltransferase domain-containing protein [Bryobacteraceae bacterium]
MAKFVCNICGKKNAHSGEPFERETPSCGSCGSTLRARAIMRALAEELFGRPVSLRDFPRVKSWRGLGTSDAGPYVKRLAEVFDYRNTFYDREPRLDLGASTGESNAYDFILSSDVFEHVAPPIEQAFRNAYNMLKPNGVLVFTVPYQIEESDEHFPDLHEYGLAEVGNGAALINRTRAGEIQVFENLIFHKSGSGRSLEMRVFSENMLRDVLTAAGFSSIRIYAQNYAPFGIVSAESWSLPIAARKGPFACGIDAMRDVIEEWQNLHERLARSTWVRIGGKLKLLNL